MDYAGAKFEYESHTTDFFNYICTKRVSRVASVIAVFLYSLTTILSVFIDTSAFYDSIGFSIIFILVCDQIPFAGRKIRSIAQIIIILAWCFIKLILVGVYWQDDDRRFSDNELGSANTRVLLFFGQGLQITLLLWTTISMIHRKNYQKIVQEHDGSVVTKLAWVSVTIGLVTSSVYFHQLKTKKEDDWHFYYGGEMLFWFGLNLSSVNFMRNNRLSTLLLMAPLCFIVPIWMFN